MASWSPWSALLVHILVVAGSGVVIVLSQQQQYNTTIRIDCGGSANFVNEYNETWLSDRFYTGGDSAEVSDPDAFSRLQERSLRFFPISNGKKNCYIVEVSKGRYSIRMFFIYGNYDHKSRTPNFDVSVEGTVVFSWRYPWSDEEAKSGVYSDLYAFIDDGDATICFYSIATDSPAIGALEIVEVDPLSYSSSMTGRDVILVNYGRFTGGLKPFGAGVSRDVDRGGRAWEPDARLASSTGETFYLSTQQPVRNANTPPNYFPELLYQSAHTLTSPGSIEYFFTVDSSLDYMIWFHFAEIDSAVAGPGERVFDILINNEVAFSAVDVAKEVGKFAAYDLVHTIKNLTGSALNITLVPRIGTPMLSGLENYALLPVDMPTDAKEVLAMRALKDSMQIPKRMGWNGDPCAPYNWDAWEGVTCNSAPNNKSLVITRVDVSGQGLKGSISGKISVLSHLLSLNLSNNNLKGSIPSGLGDHKLKIVDLSFNALTGRIPNSLGQAQLVKVVLNNNQLDGQVPVSLYSIGVRGGFINISSNKELCGVPALPQCPFFWQKEKLSTGAKVGVALSVVVAAATLASLVYLCILKRRKDDYNFGLPRQLAARSMRYQKQKSKLRGNSDDSQPIRSISSKFGFASNMNPL